MKQKHQNLETENSESKPDTRSLMLEILNELGYEIIPNDDGTITADRLGLKFFMEFGGVYVRIWDFKLYGVEEQDPKMPAIQLAVNDTNFNFGPTVVLAKFHEEDLVGVHSRRDIMVHPDFPDNVPFVAAVLDSFLKTRERFNECLQDRLTKQMESQKNRRPVGFTINNQE